jgi:hypothetical protein
MKITSLWATSALLFAPSALAQGTPTSESSASTSSAEPSCTASLIAELCDYPSPGPEFAVASSGKNHCLSYCNDHQPCDFVIFAATGPPSVGSGTCWLYPGKTYDESAGSTDCGGSFNYLSVYSKPECSGGSPTTGDCAATASPSPVAEVCGYEAPETCFETCYASSGSSHCLSMCAEADACSYAVFNPRSESGSPHSSGTCWVYTNGTFDESATTTCSGQSEQFVYENPCPKPSSSQSPSSSASSSSAAKPTGDETENTKDGVGAASANLEPGEKESSAPVVLIPFSFLALGMAMLLW